MPIEQPATLLVGKCGWRSHLVRSAYEVQVVSVEELGDNVRTEREGDAPVVLPPPLGVLVGVRPEEVAQQARVWHVRWPGDRTDLVKVVQIGREPWREGDGRQSEEKAEQWRD